ncbi:MAG: ABC transporter substrate-binding protein [Clostridiales bacterium]|nr:ABC transporter substrate-binding protein [Candidatus Equinaster intestinalis]
MKRTLSIILATLLIALLFAGCMGKQDTASVYYLNFKPEQDAAWQALAKKYSEEKGVPVKVVTASQGTYEQTLTAEIDKSEAPTLFQISGAIALDSWEDYCMDLTNTELHRELTSNDFALEKNGRVYGIAYVYEGYGIIVNKKLLSKAGYSMADLKNFEGLRRVAEDITRRKKELGFSAFTSPGLDSSSSWRFAGHLANMPLFYEFREDMIKSQPATIKGKYLDNFKAIWDLYTKNSTVEPSKLTAITGDQSTAEFKNEKAVFYQNGTWAYTDIKSIGDENIGYIPIYTGIDDDNMGLACGTENYWAINKKASEADRTATLDFLTWVVTSEEGTNALAHEMGFVSPFKKAKKVDNTLSNIMNDYVNEGKYTVTWDFNYTPNVDVWRADLVSALAAYSAGKGDWEGVKKAFVDNWKKQYEASKK